MNNVAYIISNSGTISLVMNGNTHTIGNDHVNYAKIVEALKTKNYDVLPKLVDIGQAIVQAANGAVDIRDGFVWYNGYIVDNSLTRRIINLVSGNFPFEPMVKFLENILENPSARAMQELYTFLEQNNLPITEDGCFLAYKRVSGAYKDLYTHMVDNNVGQNPKMPREMVVEDKEQTCAYGYHFCSLGYLSEFHAGEGHIMILKINPKDVVSIPVDYHNSKGRCCEYQVIGEHVIDEAKGIPEKFDQPLYNSDGSDFDLSDVCDADSEPNSNCDGCSDYDICWGGNDDEVLPPTMLAKELARKPDGTPYWNKRDKFGHFVKGSKKAKK